MPLAPLYNVAATTKTNGGVIAAMRLTLDDIWSDPQAGALPDEVMYRGRRRYRIAMVGAIGVSYAIDAVCLLFFWWAGKVSLAVALAYAGAGLTHVAVFSALHWSGISDRSPNPHLSVWQMGFAIAVELTAMAYAPQIKAFFLAIIFIIFSFGVMRLSMRVALALWLLTCVAIGVVLATFPAAVSTASVAPATALEAAAISLSFGLILLRCVLLTYYATALRARMMRQTANLADQVRAVQELATHDRLTGALNRHAALPLLEDQVQMAQRKKTASAVAMIDIDHFKAINDRHGHLAGDAILRQVVTTIEACVRPTDKLARYGGDEFLLLMPATALIDARHVVERLREAVARIDWQGSAPGLQVSISIGVTEVAAKDSAERALARADAALYDAKRGGRDAIVVAEAA